jgi:hypothetical protein
MELGYSTLDLGMLSIAAFVIWLTVNTPVAKTTESKKELKPKPMAKSRTRNYKALQQQQLSRA